MITLEQETLRSLQLVQLEIAKEIKRVCEEAGISYIMVFGTLLGAVRHKGFIPWDDDMDLGMLREDYEKFIRIAPKKLNPKYVLTCWQTDACFPHQYAKVMKRGTVFREQTYQGKAFSGIFVDIFPYDAAPPEGERVRIGRQLTWYRGLIRAKCGYHTWTSDGRFYWKRWVKNLPLRFFSLFFTNRDLRQKYDRLACRYNHTDYTDCMVQDVSDLAVKTTPHRFFQDTVQLPYEDTTFAAPADYHALMTQVYGDYMTLPPLEKQASQHSVLEIDLGSDGCDA